MSFVQSIKSCMAKSFDFSGRATRSEFWWFVLFVSVIYTVLLNLFNQPEDNFVLRFGFYLTLDVSAPWWSNLFTVIFALPFVSVFVRRAHDVGIGGDRIFAALFVALAAFTLLLKISPTQNTQKWLLIVVFGALFLGLLFIVFKRSMPLSKRFGPTPHSNPNEAPS